MRHHNFVQHITVVLIINLGCGHIISWRKVKQLGLMWENHSNIYRNPKYDERRCWYTHPRYPVYLITKPTSRTPPPFSFFLHARASYSLLMHTPHGLLEYKQNTQTWTLKRMEHEHRAGWGESTMSVYLSSIVRRGSYPLISSSMPLFNYLFVFFLSKCIMLSPIN